MSKIAKENRVVRLTDTQLIALSSAAQRDDGAIVVPDRIKGKSALKLAGKLIDFGLAREVRAEPGMPAYRRDDDGGGFSLQITEVGKSAINVAVDSNEAKDASPQTGKKGIVGSMQSIDSGALEPPEESVDAPAGTLAAGPPGAILPPSQTVEDGAHGAAARNDAVATSGRAPPRAGTKIAPAMREASAPVERRAPARRH